MCFRKGGGERERERVDRHDEPDADVQERPAGNKTPYLSRDATRPTNGGCVALTLATVSSRLFKRTGLSGKFFFWVF